MPLFFVPNLLRPDMIQMRNGSKYTDKKIDGAEAILFTHDITHMHGACSIGPWGRDRYQSGDQQ